LVIKHRWIKKRNLTKYPETVDHYKCTVNDPGHS